MRIIHCISNIDISSGGPSKSVSDLAINQAKFGLCVDIIANNSNEPYIKTCADPNLKILLVEGISFKQALNNHLLNFQVDIFHGHGIWQLPVHIMAKIARQKNIPYLITPRGMLEPWALNAGKWKKRIAMSLYQRKDISKASCIHATAKMEADNIRKQGFENPIAIIPNGINMDEFPLKKNNDKQGKKTLLFLSRIHPKKGIEFLIEAWNKLDNTIKKDWCVEIVGNGEEKYINTLKQQILKLDLTHGVKVTGPFFGTEKIKAYHNADLFVLPTYSENFGIVVAEALACGVPVITTKGTPWEELNIKNAGWWIDIGTQPLEQSLKKALSLNNLERHQMGLNGRKLIEEKYSLEQVAEKMIHLYRWILDNKDKPNFVI